MAVAAANGAGPDQFQPGSQISGQRTQAAPVHGDREQFAAWITSRIEQFKLIECKDFEVIPNFGENPQGGRPSKDYWLTLEMAKYLSMLERNAQGDLARRYFIRCEKQLIALHRAAPHRQLTHGDLARMIIEEESAKQAALLALNAEQDGHALLAATVIPRLQAQDVVIAEVRQRVAALQPKAQAYDNLVSDRDGFL